MEKSSRSPGQPLLRREVQAPQKQNTGIGVMLVASGAMFFAVASSAVILRSQVPHRGQCVRSLSQPTVQQGEPIEAMPVELVETPTVGDQEEAGITEIESCSEPIYHENADGTVSIYFDLCSPSESGE